MKLTITKADILKLVNEKYNLNLEINELAISGLTASKANKSKGKSKYENSLREAIRMYPDAMTQKISAIKHFRELLRDKDNQATIGLSEAKYAVENVEEAINRYNEDSKIHGPTW